MNKQILETIILMGFIGFSQFLFGQNVGIGTNVPTHKLTVSSTLTDDALRLIGPDGTYKHGARLNFGDADNVYFDEDLDDNLTIYAKTRTAFTGGNVGIGTLTPSQKLEVSATGNVFTRITSTNNGYPGIQFFRSGTGHIDFQIQNTGAYLQFSSTTNLGVSALTDNLNIDGIYNEVEVPGKLAVGLTSASHRLTVQSNSIYTMRLIGPYGGSYGYGARMNFGDGNGVYLEENNNNDFTASAYGGIALRMGTSFGIYSSGYKAFQILYDPTFQSIFSIKPSPSAVGIFSIGTTGHTILAPETKNYGYLGTSNNFWRNIYSSDIWTDIGFGIWVLLDTYDDLELLNNIQADTIWDENLQHHVMVMKPESFPKSITKQDTLADGSLTDVFVSYKRLTGLLIGSARQLDKETKERDHRLEARTDLIANTLGLDFHEETTIVKTINDHGSSQTSKTEIRVLFSESFKSQLSKGQKPLIHITPRSWYQQYMVALVDELGFVLKVKMDSSELGFTFNWQANAQVITSISKNEDHLDDVFYKKPIVINGEYPTIKYDPNEKQIIEDVNQAQKQIEEYERNNFNQSSGEEIQTMEENSEVTGTRIKPTLDPKPEIKNN